MARLVLKNANKPGLVNVKPDDEVIVICEEDEGEVTFWTESDTKYVLSWRDRGKDSVTVSRFYEDGSQLVCTGAEAYIDDDGRLQIFRVDNGNQLIKSSPVKTWARTQRKGQP